MSRRVFMQCPLEVPNTNPFHRVFLDVFRPLYGLDRCLRHCLVQGTSSFCVTSYVHGKFLPGSRVKVSVGVKGLLTGYADDPETFSFLHQ